MKRMAVAVVVVGLLALGGLWWWRTRLAKTPPDVLSASGTVEATEAHLGFETGGRLVVVVPHEGDAVVAGGELARIDESDLLSRRDGAAAQVAAAEARLAELLAGPRREEIAQAEAERAAAAERAEDAGRDLERTRILYESGAVPQEALDKASTASDIALARRSQAGEQVAMLRRGARPEQLAAQRAVVEQARAALVGAETLLGKAVLAAPFAGVVTVRHREPGEVVAPGAPVLTLIAPGDRWVRIYVPEDRLGAVRLGAQATLRSDSYPDKRYAGRVTFLASEAEFTPKNVQTAEERVRLVYAAKVAVLDDPRFELKPGLPVDVEIPLQPGGR
jgi:HlyD family secretion protein